MTSQDRREQILEAVLPVVLERGLGVTSKQLSEAAGVAEGTLFKAFGSKDALLRALVKRAEARPDEVKIWLEAGGAKGLTLEQLVEGIATRGVLQWTVDARMYQVLGTLIEYPDDEAIATWLAALEPWSRAFEDHRESLRISPDRAADVLRTLLWAASSRGGWGIGIDVGDVQQLFLYGVSNEGALRC